MSLPHITTSSLAAAQIGKAYAQALDAVGGETPYTWSAKGLPDGLKIAHADITGTPTKAEKSSVTLEVKDMAGNTNTVTLALNVYAQPTIGTAPLPTGTIGTPYSAQLTATGGSGTYVFSITSGTLPAGLSMSPSGLISGTPTAAATDEITFTVNNA